MCIKLFKFGMNTKTNNEYHKTRIRNFHYCDNKLIMYKAIQIICNKLVSLIV